MCPCRRDLIFTNLQNERSPKCFYPMRAFRMWNYRSSTADGMSTRRKAWLRLLSGEQFVQRRCLPSSHHRTLLRYDLHLLGPHENDSLARIAGEFPFLRHYCARPLRSFSSDRHAPDALGMSASLRSRPNLCTAANRRGVPTADSCIAAKTSLFDHLVGTGEQRGRHFEAKRLGGC